MNHIELSCIKNSVYITLVTSYDETNLPALKNTNIKQITLLLWNCS